MGIEAQRVKKAAQETSQCNTLAMLLQAETPAETFQDMKLTISMQVVITKLGQTQAQQDLGHSFGQSHTNEGGLLLLIATLPI